MPRTTRCPIPRTPMAPPVGTTLCSAMPAGLAVDCGETVDLEIDHPNANQREIAFYGETTGNYFDVVKASNPDTSAAACMVEDPGKGDNVGTIHFNYCVAKTG